ncbi:MAG: hypothetical protein WCD76_19390 [Pyrinomonadaceae bacterium]
MYDEKGRGRNGWMAVLMPSVVVVLFELLRFRLTPPTAGGLAFLVGIMLAYWLFPKTRLSMAKIVAAAALALVVTLLMRLVMPHAV